MLIGGKGGVHHIWGCDHFKTTLNATEFKRVYKRRTDLVKTAMDSVPAGDRQAQIGAIMGAIRQGGLFVVNVDIVPTQIGSCAHVMLPAATSGEANLTSMNGERRMRLTERYMDPPGSALPDSLIVARIAQALERSWRGAGKPEIADKFKGYAWKTEEDAFMDGYNKNADGGQYVTYERLKAMGTNGFQEPAIGYQDGKIIWHQAPVHRRQVQDAGRQGKVRGDRLAWPGSAGQAGGKGKIPFPDQQWPVEPGMAVGLSRSTQ